MGFAAAERASSLKPEAAPELSSYLRDADSGVRHWDAADLQLALTTLKEAADPLGPTSTLRSPP
jgi:hypothetical protein